MAAKEEKERCRPSVREKGQARKGTRDDHKTRPGLLPRDSSRYYLTFFLSFHFSSPKVNSRLGVSKKPRGGSFFVYVCMYIPRRRPSEDPTCLCVCSFLEERSGRVAVERVKTTNRLGLSF